MNETNILGIAILAFAMMLVGGLAVIPIVVDDADAKCSDGFKKNGDACKENKPKHNS